MPLPKDYLEAIPLIYQDVLKAFPKIDPSRKRGYGLAMQTIYVRLEEECNRYSLGEIRTACENLAASGVVEIKHEIFVCPTDLGEQIIAELTGESVPLVSVPPFPSPPVPAIGAPS